MLYLRCEEFDKISGLFDIVVFGCAVVVTKLRANVGLKKGTPVRCLRVAENTPPPVVRCCSCRNTNVLQPLATCLRVVIPVPPRPDAFFGGLVASGDLLWENKVCLFLSLTKYIGVKQFFKGD